MTEKGHISKLHLFAKDTDAPDVIKGFKYQELKTLEIWLHNKINGTIENIYCDYEDDIFQRNLEDYKSKFKQIKLYSSKNFSFSSIEIKKTLAHFFMLFVKGEYLLDSPEFIFETNTSIARRNGDNGAELLKEWADNQDSISENLLKRCIVQLKTIIDSYVSSQYEELTKKNVDQKFVIAKDVYEQLPIYVWEQFTQSIKWSFNGISSEEAINVSIKNSRLYISQLQFPINRDQYSLVFDTLRGAIGDKSMGENPEDRLLTNDLLDVLLLDLGDRADKIYADSYELWKNIDEIDNFNIGKFYQVLYAAKHCRINKYLKDHSTLWLTLLNQFLNIDVLFPYCRREIIYEIIWLTLRPSMKREENNSLKGLEGIVNEYFYDFEKYDDVLCLEDTLNLLAVIASTQRMNLIDIQREDIDEWYEKIRCLIITKKETVNDKNIYCSLLSIEGFMYLNLYSLGYGEEQIDKSKDVLFEILKNLSDAPLYSVNQLGQQIEGVLDLSIDIINNSQIEDFLENYHEKLLPYIEKSEGSLVRAKTYTNRAMRYLESSKPNGILKALDLLHKAKDLYFNKETYEGFVLALLTISQLYVKIGMNLAAKYYSLMAIRFCINVGDSKLYKRISDAHALVFITDYQQGAWISALDDYEMYIGARLEFNTHPFDMGSDELLRNTSTGCSLILALSPLISSQLKGYVDYQKIKMGKVYEDLLINMVKYTEDKQAEIGLTELISKKIRYSPINDIGKKRNISWAALECKWSVEFSNDYNGNSIGEEFVSLIQIIQSEIMLKNVDFHLLKGEVKINVIVIDKSKASEQVSSNSDYVWNVYLSLLNSQESKDISMHYAEISASFLGVLNELSLLPVKKTHELYYSLFEDGLRNKTLTVSSYQKAYRDVYSEIRFEDSMRSNFNSEVLDINNCNTFNSAGNFNTSLLYNKERALEQIKQRYKNTLKGIHLTLDKYKDNDGFNDFISEQKKDGWLDWQICMALFNFIINRKANITIIQKGKIYSTEQERMEDHYQTINEISKMDERENYLDIPLYEIMGPGFLVQLYKVLPFIVLEAYGLECKSKFPNPDAVRMFLNDRFKFHEDDIPELSPLKR